MALAALPRAPGVYVEWLDSNPQYLEVRRTDVAGFIGIAERGPLHAAIKLESMRQFVTTFGDFTEQAYLAHAVEGFFSNGGRTCWVVRVADPLKASLARLRLELPNGKTVVLESSSAGAWGNGISIEPIWGRDEVVALNVTERDRSQRINLQAPEEGSSVSLTDPQRTLLGLPASALPELGLGVLVNRLNEENKKTLLPVFVTSKLREIFLAGGSDGLDSLGATHFTGNPDANPTRLWGIDALDRVDGVSFIAAPDLMGIGLAGSEVREAQGAILGRCIARGDRIAILDMPNVERDEALKYRRDLPETSFGALYYPWICVDDPLRIHGTIRAIPPSGHVAGMFARTDRLRGVHKSPANEPLEGVWDLSHRIDAPAHAELNENGVNGILAMPGRGVLVMGARTLDRDPLWRYVNVRRLFAMIEEELDEQMQWLTFEPNNPRLWKEVDRAIRGFLERLYGAGMLDGATSDEAYFVHCDETTNPPSGTDEGRVVCEIGIQPPYPAEFVIVRVGVTRNGTRIEEKVAQSG